VPEEGGAIAEDKDLTYQFSVVSTQYSETQNQLLPRSQQFLGFSRSLGLLVRFGVATELIEN
jgi:hypothetical protein